MKGRATLVAALILASGPAAMAKEVTWQVDNKHSGISFSVRHLGISNVTGHIRDFDADIRADEKTALVSTVKASAQVASIDTGIDARDNHLLQEDFFYAEKFPELRLVSRKVKWNGKRFTAEIDLTIRGITKRLQAEGEFLGVRKVNFGDGYQLRAGYTATGRLDRKDFGLRFNGLAEGVALVDDEVTVKVDLEMYRRLPRQAVSVAAPQ